MIEAIELFVFPRWLVDGLAGWLLLAAWATAAFFGWWAGR